MEKKKFGIGKILLILLILLILIAIVLLIRPVKNFIIISDLQDRVLNYANSTNYYMKSIETNLDGIIITTNYYHKDDKRAHLVETDNSGEISKISMYYNGERTDLFTETLEEKTVTLDTGMPVNLSIYNRLETDSAWQTFLSCFSVKIKEVEYKDKVCYSIEDFFTPNVMYGLEKNESYIDKETGLELFNNTDGVLIEKEYEFDNVDDLIFIEPNIGEYKLIK